MFLEIVSQRHLFGRNAHLWIDCLKKEERRDDSSVLTLETGGCVACWRGLVGMGTAHQGAQRREAIQEGVWMWPAVAPAVTSQPVRQPHGLWS